MDKGRSHRTLVSMTRVSLSPYDFGRYVGTDSSGEGIKVGLEPVASPPWHVRLVGTTPITFKGSGDDHMVVLFSDGFGINVRRFRHQIDFADHHSIARILLERAQFHRSMRAGEHSDARELMDLRAALDRSAPRRVKLRPQLWQSPPYTFTFFYVHAAEGDVVTGPPHKASLAALLEPSQVLSSALLNLADRAASRCAENIALLDGDAVRARIKNCDIRANSVLLASWASLMMFDPHGDSLEYLESLELRLQGSWIRANYIRSFAESLLNESHPKLDQLADFMRRVHPLLRQSQRLIDASASTRDQRIFDELCQSSDLGREIQAAEDAVEDVKANIEALSISKTRLYDTSVQALLIVLALFQLYPVLFRTPIVEVAHSYAPLPLVVGAMLVAVLFWFKRQ